MLYVFLSGVIALSGHTGRKYEEVRTANNRRRFMLTSAVAQTVDLRADGFLIFERKLTVALHRLLNRCRQERSAVIGSDCITVRRPANHAVKMNVGTRQN